MEEKIRNWENKYWQREETHRKRGVKTLEGNDGNKKGIEKEG